MRAGRVCRFAAHLLEGGLEPEVDLRHDFGDERFFRAEIVEQHPGAGPDRGRERAEGKVGDAMTEEIGQAIVQESLASGNVTVVTYDGPAVKLKSTLGWLMMARDPHFRAIGYTDQQISATPARLRHPLVWNPENLATFHSGWNLDSKKLSARAFRRFGSTLQGTARIDPQFAAKIGPSDLETKARQRLDAELDNTALEGAAARNAEASARRGSRRNFQPVGLEAVRISRIIYVYIDRCSTKKVFNPDPDFLGDVTAESRTSSG